METHPCVVSLFVYLILPSFHPDLNISLLLLSTNRLEVSGFVFQKDIKTEKQRDRERKRKRELETERLISSRRESERQRETETSKRGKIHCSRSIDKFISFSSFSDVVRRHFMTKYFHFILVTENSFESPPPPVHGCSDFISQHQQGTCQCTSTADCALELCAHTRTTYIRGMIFARTMARQKASAHGPGT